MIILESWISPAALIWLEHVLFERYHVMFFLRQNEQCAIQLFHEGSSASIQLTTDPTSFNCAVSNLPCTRWDAVAEGWHAVLGQPLPAPGAASLVSPLIVQTGVGFRINYDILGLTYWVLSRQEEVGRTDLDEHDRFPATSSHAFQNGYLERPLVDEWLHVLGQVIQKTWPTLELRTHQFSVKVSHDVDGPSRYAFRSWAGITRVMAGDVFKRHDIRSALMAPWVSLNSRTSLHPADPDNTFDWIMNVSEHHGLKSAFYFICGRTDARKDADYEPEHPAIRHLMRRMHARGHEVGLHPSYGSFQTPSTIAAEAARLRRLACEEGIEQLEWGGRMHYLRWEHPTTLQAWEGADMTYDSTLGYADRPGFRCGTCFEYPAFDPVAGKALRLRIRPLIAMECTIMAPRYMGLGTGDAAHSKFSEIKASCMAVGGCFTLLWHNSQLDSAPKRSLYKYLLS